MNLRGKNFVSEIKHISIIQNSIKGVIGEDKYYFTAHINGITRVYYVFGVEDETGLELTLYRDLTSYYTPTYGDPTYVDKTEDEPIKTITSRTGASSHPTITTFAADPGIEMAEYVTTYLDALQTMTNY